MLIQRRNFLFGLGATGMVCMMPEMASALATRDQKSLKLYNVHTEEIIDEVFWKNGRYKKKALSKFNHFFRDWRADKEIEIEPALLDNLFLIQTDLKCEDSGLHLLSGYRSPETNKMLRRRSREVSSTSLHMKGLASDIRHPGTKLSQLRKVAMKHQVGGVGYYPNDGFVHVDVGEKREW